MKKVRKYFVKSCTKGWVFFVAIIIVIVAANLIKKDDEMSVRENRMLGQRPQVNVTDIADGKFMKDYEAYVSDQFVFREIRAWCEGKDGFNAWKKQLERRLSRSETVI